MDAHEQLGQPVASNGLPLSKIHHAAFDTHLIGIDPDFRIHVSDRLLDLHDGPFLEQGLKAMGGRLIRLPRRNEDYPDRDRLACRFEDSRSLLTGLHHRTARPNPKGEGFVSFSGRSTR